MKSKTIVLLTILLTLACGGLLPASESGPEPPSSPANNEEVVVNQRPTQPPSQPEATTESSVGRERNPVTTTRDSVCPAQYFLTDGNAPANLPAVSLTARCEGAHLIVQTNSIPNHPTGEFPTRDNPNAIAPVQATYELPLNPAIATQPTYYRLGMLFGIALNGIPFDPIAAEFWNDDPRSGWNVNPVKNRDLGIDTSNAHVQPTGKYHYHAMPEGLLMVLNKGEAVTLIGYAADGFPVYARYGYSQVKDASSAIKVIQSSYRLKSGTRPNGPGGAYDGTYVEDYEYVSRSGDLDACNGRFGVTPEYPEGVYHYYVTDDFPYVPRCHIGTPTMLNAPPDGGLFPPPRGGQPSQSQPEGSSPRPR